MINENIHKIEKEIIENIPAFLVETDEEDNENQSNNNSNSDKFYNIDENLKDKIDYIIKFNENYNSSLNKILYKEVEEKYQFEKDGKVDVLEVINIGKYSLFEDDGTDIICN
ncbi:6439_t:CDS:2 [Cetraspora pellucida]|uniref:6439_t:CDS:1 n=1 Tax=Cetraspora pellucida TaxID=1433469 RepID=A0A9N9IL71_9GLOM|nr:6439_t:CDS:2 [Cetraspora pellucida]